MKKKIMLFYIIKKKFNYFIFYLYNYIFIKNYLNNIIIINYLSI